MGETNTSRATRTLQAACAVLASCAVAVFAVRSLATPLWMDELLTMTLVQAQNLPKLWSGIAMGIDGNPPLYLTIAWLIAHGTPLPPVALLKLTNIALAVAATFALYRVSRRVASARACWIGAFMFAALNDNLIHAALEMRTYALYFLMAVMAVLFQQRLIERPRASNGIALALIYAALALAHTYGIVYVACIALAGWLSQWRDGSLGWRPIAAAAAPAILVVACWTPFFIGQSATGRPYLWFAPPDLPELLETLFATKLAMWIALVELGCLASAALLALQRGEFQYRSILFDASWQPFRYVTLVLAAITGFTLTAWVVSVTLFPLFVPRYFMPQLIVSFALHVAFGEWLVRQTRRSPAGIAAGFAISAIVAPPALLGAVMLLRVPERDDVPCTDSTGAYFESEYVHGDLPVIAESPHVFLPRAAYAAHGSAYLFPLDWDVVLKYPQRARGNAVDFHVLENIKRWANRSSIKSTEDILRQYPQFLMIEESGRAWFHNLKATHDVTAEKLKEASTEYGPTCTLWKVTGVKARP